MSEQVFTREVQNGRLTIPANYRPKLNLRETEEAIKFIKDTFQARLASTLNLTRVSAPILVLQETGINDHLSGTERPVTFRIRDFQQDAEIVQSLAKWKRMALADYEFGPGEGLYTDMNALRPDEHLDNLHSIYVDQWDWERVVAAEERTVSFLEEVVRGIYRVIRDTERTVSEEFQQIHDPILPAEIQFIHTSELAERYPSLSPDEREDAVCKEYGAVFLRGIGAAQGTEEAHDDRAADYDDWTSEGEDGHRGLNGDILIWYPVLHRALELSSMGIRVDEESLMTQLEVKDELFKTDLYFHQRLLDGELPLTIGGGIGQSRLCMFMLKKAHVGEVQSSVWPEEMRAICQKHNMFLL